MHVRLEERKKEKKKATEFTGLNELTHLARWLRCVGTVYRHRTSRWVAYKVQIQ